MNARTNSTASAPSVERLIALANIGELAMAHHRAVSAANAAKHLYHQAIEDYEGGDRTPVGGPGWDELTEATTTEFAAYRAAQRAAYNIKRRLENACRKFN